MVKRWLIRSVFMLPIVVCVVGWAWSGWYGGWIAFGHRGYAAGCSQDNGTARMTVSGGPHAIEGWIIHFYRLSPSPQFWPLTSSSTHCYLGFSVIHEAAPDWSTSMSVPYWSLLLVFGGLLFLVWRMTRPKNDPRTAFPVEVKAKA